VRVDGDVYLGVVDGIVKGLGFIFYVVIVKGVERPRWVCNTVAIQASHYASAAVGSPP